MHAGKNIQILNKTQQNKTHGQKKTSLNACITYPELVVLAVWSIEMHPTAEILVNWKAVTLLGTTCSLAPSSGSSCPLPPEHFFFFPWLQRAAEEFWRRTQTAGTSGEGRLVEAGGSTRGDLRGPEAVEGWSEAYRRRSLELRTEVQSPGWPRGGPGGRRGWGRVQGARQLPPEESSRCRAAVCRESVWPEASLQPRAVPL